MSSNSEESNDRGSPSEIALRELRQRVEADAYLSEDFRTAVINDLTSQAPAALTNLKAILGTKGVESAA